jgi:branched-chain amino acid transport system substrate-binding protein
MSKDITTCPLRRRTVLKAGLAIGIMQVANPFLLRARGETPVKIGVDEPLTGTYAAAGKNEVLGCQLAVDQLNAKNGILGRKVEMLTEDSTSGDAGTAVQKARKLIERDNVNFLVGNVNSALSQAMAQVSNEKMPAPAPRNGRRNRPPARGVRVKGHQATGSTISL